jgi:hypothetical protein
MGCRLVAFDLQRLKGSTSGSDSYKRGVILGGFVG